VSNSGSQKKRLLSLLGSVFVAVVASAQSDPANPTPANPTPANPTPANPTPANPTADSETPAQEFPPTVQLTRKDKVIKTIKYGPADMGLAILCTPLDDDTDRTNRFVYSDETPYLVHVFIDKNVIKAPIAFVSKKQNGDGQLEAYAGTAVESSDENVCLPVVKADPKPGTVFVEQGKTKLTGSRLDYSQETGIAVIAGPITFERPQKNDKLTGTSEKITVNVDEEKTFLEGTVVLKSKCRTSQANKVEYNDKRNLAILFGSPAISIQTDPSGKQVGEVRGERIEYNLETNDVIVTFGNAKGSKEAPLSVFADDSKACE
jgi:lipopolysaccharide export system protein LptA